MLMEKLPIFMRASFVRSENKLIKAIKDKLSPSEKHSNYSFCFLMNEACPRVHLHVFVSSVKHSACKTNEVYDLQLRFYPLELTIIKTYREDTN